MFPSNIELLKHILEETSFILDSTIGKNKEDVINDPILSRALIRSLEIIGEASNKVDPAFKSLYPHVEWRKMSGTRNRLIHDYFGIDYDIVWDIIISKLPDLRNAISEIISEY
ncbi:HepT-like ribonuclease domain-containing protein [Pedobacter sp. AW31-3R]|uniref:HepT-like ribonuclease domain-containing protein n=1 Tax=Pedobacter sp. AW31-3R TaxID=3445781 RepID=UPI003FA12CDA